MAKLFHHHLLLHLRRSRSMYASPTTPLRLLRLHPKQIKLSSPRFLSTTATPYPLQYEMIISRPANPPPRRPSRSRTPAALPKSQPEVSGPNPDMGFDEWVDKKLSSEDPDGDNREVVMDKAKRKYYNKRRKRMYGESKSDEENGRRGNESDFIELKQEIVEPRTFLKREEELYFYDAFAYPWEKNKHYKMVYRLEKKYFHDQCFDKAFLEPGKTNVKKGKKDLGSKGVVAKGEDDRGLVFFEENEKEKKDVKDEDVTEKKVEDFFKCLKKFPNENGKDVKVVEPFLSTRSVGLPPKWDGPNGTVVLVNKPKG